MLNDESHHLCLFASHEICLDASIALISIIVYLLDINSDPKLDQMTATALSLTPTNTTTANLNTFPSAFDQTDIQETLKEPR